MPSPKTKPALTWRIMLDRTREIRWSNRALYRLQSLPGGYDLSQVENDRRSVATIADFIWAMLEPRDRLPAPEDVADVLPLDDEDAMRTIMADVSAAIEHGQKGDEAKNGSAGPSPTPGSSAA